MHNDSLPPVIPLFDKPEFIIEGNSYVNQYITAISLHKVSDAGLILEHATDWLYEHKDQENNYKAYRSELTPHFAWAFTVAFLFRKFNKIITKIIPNHHTLNQILGMPNDFFVEAYTIPTLTLCNVVNATHFTSKQG